MNKLIKNEFKKLFSKKLMYILVLITVGFIILTNVIYNIEDPFNDSEYLQTELSFLEEEMNLIDYKLEENNEYYIDLKTDYDLIKLKLNYEYGSWQYNFIETSDAVYTNLRNINKNTYGINKNEEELKKAQKEFRRIEEKLNKGDWQVFVKEQLADVKEEIKEYETTLKDIKDKQVIEQVNSALENARIIKQTLEWRIEKNVPYDNSFLSNKIETYEYEAQTVNSLKNKENKTKEEEQEYNDALKQMNISKYYIENDINIENEYNARYILSNLMTEYGMFISIFTIIIAGTIVSNEFQKGTIKLLLTKPFSRNKILLSKYIVSILSIFIFIVLFAVLQYVIGGLISGFEVYNVPIVEYDLSTNTIAVMSVFKHLILVTLTSLPMYIFASTLAFALSTIIMNSAVAIALPILVHMLSVTINLFIEKIKILRYSITANWDLSIYLFGGKGVADGLSFWISLAISIIYILVILITTFTVFNRRDIKNV